MSFRALPGPAGGAYSAPQTPVHSNSSHLILGTSPHAFWDRAFRFFFLCHSNTDFSLKIWHLVATIWIILMRLNWAIFSRCQISREKEFRTSGGGISSRLHARIITQIWVNYLMWFMRYHLNKKREQTRRHRFNPSRSSMVKFDGANRKPIGTVLYDPCWVQHHIPHRFWDIWCMHRVTSA